MSEIINETIGLLHSMVLSGEKTDGTVSDMVTKSLDEIEKLQAENKKHRKLLKEQIDINMKLIKFGEKLKQSRDELLVSAQAMIKISILWVPDKASVEHEDEAIILHSVRRGMLAAIHGAEAIKEKETK